MNFNTETYNAVFTSNADQNKPVTFYALKDTTKYHVSRFVAANAQNIYSEAGLTKPLLQEICTQMTDAINRNKLDEVAVWVNNLKARMNYPVDEDSALRMAMIYHFIDGEDPDKVESHWTEKKLSIIKADPEAYSFFLPIGLAYTPSYTEYLEEVSQNYLNQRKMTINQLTPQHPQS